MCSAKPLDHLQTPCDAKIIQAWPSSVLHSCKALPGSAGSRLRAKKKGNSWPSFLDRWGKQAGNTPEGTGWLNKWRDLFGECHLPANLSYSKYSTSKPLAFLVAHKRMWALAPHSNSDWKVKEFPKSRVMFPIGLPAAPTLGWADKMFCSSALYSKIHLQC